MKRILLLTLSVLTLASPSVLAQGETTQKDYNKGWYVGVQAGMPMAEGTFSSFGADKFRPGWNLGLHGGYRFSQVWSLELTANWGGHVLGEQDCCYDRGYLLGLDWNRYHPTYIPEGMKGFYYKDLKSNVCVQRYGLQLNMNILGFFESLKESRWRLDISPAVYGVGTSSEVRLKSNNAYVRKHIDNWHLGYGGLAQVSYAVTKNLNLGIYGGFIHLTGAPLDGMPAIHLTNFIIDAGVKLSWNFGRKSRKSTVTPAAAAATAAALATSPATSTTVAAPAAQPQSTSATPATATTVKTPITAQTAATPTTAQTAAKPQPTAPATVTTATPAPAPAVTKPATAATPAAASIKSDFPLIYFSFNSIWIEPSERAKVKAIADRMKADKSIRIRVTGWCDEIGGEVVNQRVSLQRAEAVKRVLGQWLIPAERIEVVGGGINRTTTDRKEARIATTIVIVE